MNYSMFGTDGVRGAVGEQPFTAAGLARLGDAIAQWACLKYGKSPKILMAHDTRISAGFVKSVLKSRLLLRPLIVYDAQVLSSPAVVQLMHQDSSFDCGIIISASHNPYTDNGIKIIDAYAGKLTQEDERIISQLYAQGVVLDDQYVYANLGTEICWESAQKNYLNYLELFFTMPFLQGKKIVLDCAHGAAYRLAPEIFRRLGADVIALHCTPNGSNINTHCGALYPASLQQAVLDYQADAGFAFDGDADRVIAVNRLGQVRDGDDILALLLTHPLYAGSPAIVGTIMTNQGFEYFLKMHGRQLVRTNVGDKYVAAGLAEHGLLLGGEPSGHIIAADYLKTGDGIFIALRVLQALTLSDNWDMKTFVKFPQVMINVPVICKKDLSASPACDIIALMQQQLHVGRLVVRYSGTEPVLRIMIEDDDFDHAQSVALVLSKQLQQVLM